jgi:hypothetical protein
MPLWQRLGRKPTTVPQQALLHCCLGHRPPKRLNTWQTVAVMLTVLQQCIQHQALPCLGYRITACHGLIRMPSRSSRSCSRCVSYSCKCCCYCCCLTIAAAVLHVVHTQVRDPVAGVFSAETMLRGMGVPLPWSLAAPLAVAAPGSLVDSDVEAAEADLGADSRFKVRRGVSRIPTMGGRVVAGMICCQPGLSGHPVAQAGGKQPWHGLLLQHTCQMLAKPDHLMLACCMQICINDSHHHVVCGPWRHHQSLVSSLVTATPDEHLLPAPPPLAVSLPVLSPYSSAPLMMTSGANWRPCL